MTNGGKLISAVLKKWRTLFRDVSKYMRVRTTGGKT